MKKLLIFLLFLLGLYVYTTSREGMENPCPKVLIQQGERILLQKSIDDKDPVIFHSLDEYAKYVKENDCPVLVLQPMKDAQNELKYQVRPPLKPPVNGPQNTDSFPGFNAQPQYSEV
jgi:hypothetical protein